MKPVETTLSFDEMMDALRDVHRRTILLGLGDHESRPTDSAGSPDETSRRSQVAMRHVHLPKLDTAGLVVWDERRNRVSRGPRFEEIRPLLRLLDDNRDALPADWA